MSGGIDLVEHQLRVAAGEPLSIGEVELSGHAIEARVYAEDSFGGFLPQAGTATFVRWPETGDRHASASELGGRRIEPLVLLRVDHALESGQVVSTAYDPMLGKVIAHGPDRESARQALVAALDDTAILGLTTNAGFLRSLVASDEFRDATIDTAWLDHHDLAPPDPAPARELAAWEVFLRDREDTGPFVSDGFRIAADPAPVVVELDEPVTLTVPPARRAVAAVRHDRVEVVHHGQRFVFDRPDVMGDHAAAAADGALTAPMPGTVLDVRVAEGDAVEEGQVLGVLEAMKMELSLKAPFAGTVTTVGARAGEQVALGDTLFVSRQWWRVPMTLPERVTIYEVGPRDGLQNEKSMVPVDVKEQFVRRLLAAGLPIVEATSFVHPKWVPQLADAEELMTRLGPDGKELPVLVPNERGLDRALELGLEHIAIFGSATETFAQKNLNRGLDEQFAMFEPTVKRARDAGLDVRAYVSMCFGDPWEGAVPVEQVVSVGKRLFDLGAGQLSLGDTIGVGTAGQVTSLIDAFVAAGMAKDDLAMHFHDTYGQALANTYSALQSGITTYDASAGGLGGCPYAKSATGNLATEDLVWLLNGLGIEHGVDLDALVATSAWMAGELGRPSPSAVVRALSQSDT